MKDTELKEGMKFNYLTAITDSYIKNKRRYAIFKCDCGKEKEIRVSNVIDPHGTKSCGCMQRVLSAQSKHNYKHGLCYSRIYAIWRKMRQRCNNPNYSESKYYGGRGIKVCEEWDKSFDAFYDWALKNGYQDDLSIDRIDTNGNYEPSNCKWSTNIEQGNNKRNNVIITIDDQKMTLAQWCRCRNLPYSRVQARLYRGWSEKEALEFVPRYR